MAEGATGTVQLNLSPETAYLETTFLWPNWDGLLRQVLLYMVWLRQNPFAIWNGQLYVARSLWQLGFSDVSDHGDTEQCRDTPPAHLCGNGEAKPAKAYASNECGLNLLNLRIVMSSWQNCKRCVIGSRFNTNRDGVSSHLFPKDKTVTMVTDQVSLQPSWLKVVRLRSPVFWYVTITVFF